MANGDFPPDQAPPDFDTLAKAIAGAFSQLADFTFLKIVPSNFIAESIALVLTLPLKLLADVVVLAAETMLKLLENVRPETSALASVALSEVFGTDVQVSAGRGGFNGGQATALGATVLGRLLPILEGGTQTMGPSAVPAEQFLGELLGVSVRAWLLEFVSDLMPESVRIAPFNDLVESVLGATGISRLARVALRPAIQAAVAEPLQWLVLDALRPTLLGEGQAVQSFLRGKWTRQQLDDELGAKGYSFDRQEAIINDVQKSLGVSDLRVLVKNQVWTDEQAVQILMDQGYPNGNAQALVSIGHLEEIDALRPRAIAAFELQWRRGKIDDGAFVDALAALQIRPDVAGFWLRILHAEQAAGFKVLDQAQLKAALAANVISLPEWRAGLALLGYAPDDITILELTEQGALASREAGLEKRAAAKAQAEADRAAAKAQAKADREARAEAAKAAKDRADQRRIELAAQRAETLVVKQKLLADQAQARRDQIANAKAAALLTAAQEQAQLAQVAASEQAAALVASTHAQTQAALDQAAALEDQRQLAATAAAEAAGRNAADAVALADNQQAALLERRTERIATFQAERDKVATELDQGLITANAAARAVLELGVQEAAAVKAERLDQLAIARAQRQAQTRAAGAAAAAAKAKAAAGLVPTATSRQAATIAATAAAKSRIAAATLQARTGAQAKIAADRASATLAATAQLDALAAAQVQALADFERQHTPKP